MQKQKTPVAGTPSGSGTVKKTPKIAGTASDFLEKLDAAVKQEEKKKERIGCCGRCS